MPQFGGGRQRDGGSLSEVWAGSHQVHLLGTSHFLPSRVLHVESSYHESMTVAGAVQLQLYLSVTLAKLWDLLKTS